MPQAPGRKISAEQVTGLVGSAQTSASSKSSFYCETTLFGARDTIPALQLAH